MEISLNAGLDVIIIIIIIMIRTIKDSLHFAWHALVIVRIFLTEKLKNCPILLGVAILIPLSCVGHWHCQT